MPVTRDEDDTGDAFSKHPFQEVVSLCAEIVPALAICVEVNDHAISVGDHFERRRARFQGCFQPIDLALSEHCLAVFRLVRVPMIPVVEHEELDIGDSKLVKDSLCLGCASA